jgi:hypothetical protein
MMRFINRPNSATAIALGSALISLLSMAVSVITLYVSQLRPAVLSDVIGPEIKLYYPSDGGFGVYLPATFVNQSPNTGTVFRCGITIFNKASPEERYFMEWRFFAQLSHNGENTISYALEEPAHALAIPGNSSIAKIIWITWRATSRPEIRISEGEYVLLFHYWDSTSGKPHNEVHEFYIDEALYKELDEYRTTKQNTIIDVVLDRTVGANKLLNSYEAKSLFGED